MKRFIRYLYEYENEKRIRNVGFVKVEAGDEETIVHIQAKGFQENEDRNLVIYLFYKKNGNIVRIRQTETRLTSPVLSEHIRCTRSDMKESGVVKIYEMLSGILLETEKGRRIAATWDDEPIDVGQVKEYEPEKVKEPGHSAPGTEFAARGKEQDTPLEEKHSFPRRKNTTKIQIQDIVRLPRCEWKLANNQFLIHGYNSFHHLLLIEEGNYLKLGVPGIYHIEEAKCADIYGFGEFISAEELGIDTMTEQEDMDKGECFGYWSRSVRGKFK